MLCPAGSCHSVPTRRQTSNSFRVIHSSLDKWPSEVLRPTLPMAKWGSARPHALHMMIRGSGTDSPMDLWGSTLAPFR